MDSSMTMWTETLSGVLGVWLIAAPTALGYSGAAMASDRIVGALVAAITIAALWEVTRPVRRVKVVFALWLLVAPWILNYGSLRITLHSFAIGVLLMILAIIPRPVRPTT